MLLPLVICCYEQLLLQLLALSLLLKLQQLLQLLVLSLLLQRSLVVTMVVTSVGKARLSATLEASKPLHFSLLKQGALKKARFFKKLKACFFEKKPEM
jgi:hypothetical protein